MDSLQFAAAHGSQFNGILCGRATWKGATEALITQGEAAAKAWLAKEGLNNLNALNQQTATPIQN